jgi:hypothetical protein
MPLAIDDMVAVVRKPNARFDFSDWPTAAIVLAERTIHFAVALLDAHAAKLTAIAPVTPIREFADRAASLRWAFIGRTWLQRYK